MRHIHGAGKELVLLVRNNLFYRKDRTNSGNIGKSGLNQGAKLSIEGERKKGKE